MKIGNGGLYLLLCLGISTAAVATFTGCAGNKYERSTGEYIDDKSLAERVRHALHENPDYKFDDVEVEVFRGDVQLNGFVNMSEQKSKAEEIAKGVQGVKQVTNNLTVKS